MLRFFYLYFYGDLGVSYSFLSFHLLIQSYGHSLIKMLSSFALWLSLATVSLAGTSRFKLELTWTKGSPDGFERDMIHINGQYPGPTLKIQQGDWVEVEVCNQMPFNTSIHFHGSS
jgi:FtsP/CotA-like multicopper oxidase with cupredoxin domain